MVDEYALFEMPVVSEDGGIEVVPGELLLAMSPKEQERELQRCIRTLENKYRMSADEMEQVRMAQVLKAARERLGELQHDTG